MKQVYKKNRCYVLSSQARRERSTGWQAVSLFFLSAAGIDLVGIDFRRVLVDRDYQYLWPLHRNHLAQRSVLAASMVRGRLFARDDRIAIGALKPSHL